jgi:hypothetical protein
MLLPVFTLQVTQLNLNINGVFRLFQQQLIDVILNFFLIIGECVFVDIVETAIEVCDAVVDVVHALETHPAVMQDEQDNLWVYFVTVVDDHVACLFHFGEYFRCSLEIFGGHRCMRQFD